MFIPRRTASPTSFVTPSRLVDGKDGLRPHTIFLRALPPCCRSKGKSRHPGRRGRSSSSSVRDETARLTGLTHPPVPGQRLRLSCFPSEKHATRLISLHTAGEIERPHQAQTQVVIEAMGSGLHPAPSLIRW